MKKIDRDKIAVTFRLSRSMKKQLEDFAFLTGRTLSGSLEMILRDRFQQEFNK